MKQPPVFLHLLATLLLTGTAALGQAQDWELRVCAEPANLPFSNLAEEGFENRIAAIIADELGAKLSYAWLPRPVGRARDLYLQRGECDAVMGISDGHEGFLTTLAYYRSPYVFVYREDSPFEIGSFDDPILRDLEIAVMGGGNFGPAGFALAKRGLVENQVSFAPDNDRPDPLSAPIDAVAEGRVDVAVAWGPAAGYAAQQQPVALELVPVNPQVELPFVSMVIPIAIGVRPGDEALRDRLNVALARRWDDIQRVLEAYGVPLEPLPEPMPEPMPEEVQPTDNPLRIGFVLPTRTGSIPINPDGEEIAAEAARRGAVLAGEDVGLREPGGERLDVLVTTAPSAEAARRAGERLVGADGAFALVGGFGEEQAQVLSKVAEARDVLFFNIGSPSETLRNEGCRPHTFHIEASATMYLEALAEGLSQTDSRRWFLVYPESEAGERLYRRAREVFEQRGQVSEVVGRAVTLDGSDYPEVIGAIREAAPDVVLLLLDWRDQLEFLGFYDAFGLEPTVTGFPYPVAQTREFYSAARETVLEGALPRVALWEAGLDTYGAEALNTRFRARWGVPMDPSAWAAYAAVVILSEAAVNTRSEGSAKLIGYLEDPAVIFDVYKGGVSFRPQDHQLRQSLFLVEIESNAAASWDLATLVGEVPASSLPDADPIERLKQTGLELQRCKAAQNDREP